MLHTKKYQVIILEIKITCNSHEHLIIACLRDDEFEKFTIRCHRSVEKRESYAWDTKCVDELLKIIIC